MYTQEVQSTKSSIESCLDAYFIYEFCTHTINGYRFRNIKVQNMSKMGKQLRVQKHMVTMKLVTDANKYPKCYKTYQIKAKE